MLCTFQLVVVRDASRDALSDRLRDTYSCRGVNGQSDLLASSKIWFNSLLLISKYGRTYFITSNSAPPSIFPFTEKSLS